MKKYKLGFLGCGNMAQAIISSLICKKGSQALSENGIIFDISVCDNNEKALDYANNKNLTVYNNIELVNKNDIILLAVKPQIYKEAIKDINFNSKPVISIMAGVNIDKLCELSNKVARVMPNLNAKTRNSYNAYCTKGLSDEDEFVVKTLLSSFGSVKKVKECDINKITGICGSGPAFVFMFIEAFEQTAIECGFDSETARDMALKTIIGSALTIENLKYEDKICEMVDSVCSKGGTTIQGVNYLIESKFMNIVNTAIKKAILRAEELDKS